MAPPVSSPGIACTSLNETGLALVTYPSHGRENARSQDGDLAVVADHEAVRPRLAGIARDRHIAPEQRGLDAPRQIPDRGAGDQDRVLDLGVLDHAVLTHGRVGTDVSVGEARARPDDGGAPHTGALQPR